MTATTQPGITLDLDAQIGHTEARVKHLREYLEHGATPDLEAAKELRYKEAILASLIRLREIEGDAKQLREKLFDNPILRDPGNDHYREGYEDGLNDMADDFEAALLPRGKP